MSDHRVPTGELVHHRALAQVKCRYGCNDPAVGLFHVPAGCVCWQDPVQALCMQHLVSLEPLGAVECLVDFRLAKEEPK